MNRTRVLELCSRLYCFYHFGAKPCPGHDTSTARAEYGVEKDNTVLEPEMRQLFGQTLRASLIFFAERQSLLVQVQHWDDVAVLCLRSGLVVVQDVALQVVAVSARGGTGSAQSVHGLGVSSGCMKVTVFALVGESP